MKSGDPRCRPTVFGIRLIVETGASTALRRRMTLASRRTASSYSPAPRWLKESRSSPRPSSPDVERRAGDVGDARPRRRPGAARACRAPSGSVSQVKKPPVGSAPRADAAGLALERRRQRAPVRGVELAGRGSRRSKCPARPYSSTIRCPRPPAHWSVSCLAAASCSTTSGGPAAQPSRTPGQKIFENVPACSTTSGPSDHSDGSGVSVEGHLAVGDVLDDQHAVAAAELDQRARGARAPASAPTGSGTRGSRRGASGAGPPPAAPPARRRRARRRPSRSRSTSASARANAISAPR